MAKAKFERSKPDINKKKRVIKFKIRKEAI